MDFKSERTAISAISETIIKSGVSLYNAIKYIYSLAADDFYNVNVKDVLKVVLNNISDSDCLQALGLRINNNRCPEMNCEEYNRVLSLIVFSFAVRIPTLRKVEHNGKTMTDEQLKAIYDIVISKGAINYNNIITDNYLETRYFIKKNKPVPAYSADWFKTYVYTSVPSLCEITNKNMFLLGFVDILFAMFYSCLEEELQNLVLSLCAD